MALGTMVFDEEPLKIKGIKFVSSSALSQNGTLSVTNNADGYNPHKIFIVAFGTWNHSSLLAVFPNNGGNPVVRTIATYSTSGDGYTITANGSWGFTIKNTLAAIQPVTVFEISKVAE